jgi:DNA-directed RNA polymerase specialized sigma24 family protein
MGAYLKCDQNADEIADNTSKPWLNNDSRLLHTEAIRAASKDWDAETWERFLKATVETDMSRNEVVWDHYESLLEDEQTDSIWTPVACVPEHVHKQIHRAIRTLAPIHKATVRGIFFYELSQVEIARKLKVSPPAVSQIKKKSLSKIEDLLRADLNTVAYLIGGSANLPLEAQTREQELRDVYCQDLNGSYMK